MGRWLVPGVGPAVRRGLAGSWVCTVSAAFQARHECCGTPRLRLKADRLSKPLDSAGGKVPPPSPLTPSSPPVAGLVAGSARFCIHLHPRIGDFSEKIYARSHISWYHARVEAVNIVVRGTGWCSVTVPPPRPPATLLSSCGRVGGRVCTVLHTFAPRNRGFQRENVCKIAHFVVSQRC